VEPEHPHPHDAFFKSYFGNQENLTELVKASFPASLTRLLDFSTLTIEPGTYIDEELQAHFSDLAASVQTTTGEAKVYVLVEHKSYHKEFLRKRIAWLIQALAEGDLSERARRGAH
jgi:predicted transposase/invertase (TIGR01784 family)